MLGSNHPKPLQDINVNTSHHVCTTILTVTTSSAGISHITTSVELLEVKNILFISVCLISLLVYDKSHNHIWFHLILGLGLDLYLVTGSAKVHISIVVLIRTILHQEECCLKLHVYST
jgi:hypothetical protein